MKREMALFLHLIWLWRLMGCEVFEDLSAICGPIIWNVPW